MSAPDWDAVLAHVPEARRADVRAIVEKQHRSIITTSHPVVIDESGILRFKAEPFARWLYLVAIPSINGQMFLADAVVASKEAAKLGAEPWSIERVKQHYRDFGITLDSFAIVFGVDGPWSHLERKG